ncbi:4-(cytidine 5'-diphospho)-2-C-methyl-D-erythritol kinase [Sphingobacterium chuzhouense]|uniref:4-diphosphocytidyl-2-C-methyl-D-erythritol kinase n=1 Tax=Sphingobacterium chuzhouense TaxID=1742264 RepID=A0ABR7XQH8_9SPHI|nr:4-(cytidine 5'-diphospho)-2-C-methyl-D-erythritol kinase [Sphingobacterium chuzhouense]MBD1421422.1 4-(cytidine 5'-diphospho)-2-C-methyl-D-erythritol kinase [Sphingobacterium chuzhouense]
MISFANAKINIGLNIVGKRADGYHLLESVFCPFPLYDIIEITSRECANKTTLEITGLHLPIEDNNLCLKAYRLLAERFSLPPVHIHLHKQIPYGAGLGGGSSDGAFVLKMLNEKFNVGLSALQLEEEAAKLGADCPFFIQNKPRYAEGIGIDFSPVSIDLSDKFLVLVKPEINIATAEAYQHIVPRPAKEDLREVLRFPIQDWKFYIKNDFEEGVFEKYPIIREIKLALYAQGAIYASMSGSGSAVYGIFPKPVDLTVLNDLGHVYYPIVI